MNDSNFSDLLSEKVISIQATLAEAKAAGWDLNEAQTEMIIIDPILTTLGYAPLEIYKRGHDSTTHKYPDYTLLPQHPRKWFLEVKRLDLPLQDGEAAQAVNYANNQGAQWAVLTNGRKWYIYQAHLPKPLAEKRVFQINDLFTEPQALETLQLLSRASMIGGGLTDAWITHQVAQIVRRELLTPHSTVRKALRKVAAGETQSAVTDSAIGHALETLFETEIASGANLQGIPASEIRPADTRNLRSLSEWSHNQEAVTNCKPKLLQLQNGSLLPVKSWSALAQSVVKFLGENYGLPTLPFTGSDKGLKYFLNSVPIRADGKPMITTVSLDVSGRTLYLDMNRSAFNTITGLVALMKSVNAPIESIRLAIDSSSEEDSTS